jgi:thioredoxin-dependent peroxiredoxin
MRNLVKLFTLLAAVTLSTRIVQANPADFTLKSATGTNTFTLSEAKGKFVALHFLLKTECPFCLKHTRTYTEKSAGDDRVIHVFIKPDTDEEIKAWAGDLGGQFSRLTIYRDPDAKLAEQYGIPGGYQFHGQVTHYPSLVLLDGTGKEVFRYVGKNNTDRYPYVKFAALLQELTSKPKP